MLERSVIPVPDRRIDRWEPSPRAATAIRVAAFILPIVTAYFVVRTMGDHLYRPAGGIGLLLWSLQAAVLALATSLVTDRGARKLLPLASLLSVSLAFPDRAPSRFRFALRTGSLRRLDVQFDEEATLGDSEAAAVRRAIELVAALGAHDRRTRGHADRVRAYADLIAEEMQLSRSERDKLAWGALLHDLGKLRVPADILDKTDPLTDDEWAILRRHPADGVKMLGALADWLGPWALAARDHHERWDGDGYPSGLAGEEISLAGRITAVADAYDVMTSKRSYKAPVSPEEARQELVASAGTRFDPEVVRAMLNVSLGQPLSGGPFAWLLQLPIGQAAASVLAKPAMIVGIASAASLGAVPAPVSPDALGFVDEPLTTVPTDQAEPSSGGDPVDRAGPPDDPTGAEGGDPAGEPADEGEPDTPGGTTTTTTTAGVPGRPTTTGTAPPTSSTPSSSTTSTTSGEPLVSLPTSIPTTPFTLLPTTPSTLTEPTLTVPTVPTVSNPLSELTTLTLSTTLTLPTTLTAPTSLTLPGLP